MNIQPMNLSGYLSNRTGDRAVVGIVVYAVLLPEENKVAILTQGRLVDEPAQGVRVEQGCAHEVTRHADFGFPF